MHSMRVRLSVQNFFVQETSKNVSHTTCNYCLRKGHIFHLCPLRKSNMKIIQVWVPKGTKPQKMVSTYIGPKLNVKARKVWFVVLQVCLKANEELWYLDSGCSRHMSGNASLFSEIKKKKYGSITFGDNKVGQIIGISKIGRDPLESLENVCLVEGLRFNLLSISQFPTLWQR